MVGKFAPLDRSRNTGSNRNMDNNKKIKQIDMSKNLDIDLPKMFARYAETNNQSLVEREFGISRYRVVQLWKSLPNSEREEYINKVRAAREHAVTEHSIEVEFQIKEYLRKLNSVKMTLLTKLETCVLVLDSAQAMSITRIKDASAALKNLSEVSDDDNKETENIIQKLTRLGVSTDD